MATPGAAYARRSLIGLAAGWTVATGTLAAVDPLYPAAQCAALRFGLADYARATPYLDFNPQDVEAAEAFRAVALRFGGSEAEVDGFIADQRVLMARLVEAYVYSGDSQSRDLFERLVQTCGAFAARHPETRDLG